MHPALQGALIGLAIGAVLVFFEYAMINKAVNERAKKYNPAAEVDVTERRRTARGGHGGQVLGEYIPGGTAEMHTDPGEELGYVLEGALRLEVAGQPPGTLNAGEVFFIPAGVVHDGMKVGSGPAKVLATYVVEKGKPVASPAN